MPDPGLVRIRRYRSQVAFRDAVRHFRTHRTYRIQAYFARNPWGMHWVIEFYWREEISP